jgi:hypothetical protein
MDGKYSNPLLSYFDACWQNLRLFAYRNRTIFEALFIIVYTLEQAALIFLTYYAPENITLSVSVFALAVLTTFSVHKLVMESRIKLLEGDVAALHTEVSLVTSEMERMDKRNENLYSAVIPFLKESLNTRKPKGTERGDAYG